MSRLLIATDHCFLRHGGRVLDAYCFDRAFFDDYRAVFDQVEVLARVRPVESLPRGASLSDGDGVTFLDVPPLGRIRWLLLAERLARPRLESAIARADAVVVRVPSRLGAAAAAAALRHGKPYMIEVIGEPASTLAATAGLVGRPFAWWEARRLRATAQGASVASYVTGMLLPDLYPAPRAAAVDFISSIRLSRSEFRDARSFPAAPRPLRIATVAALIPHKRQQDLLAAAAIAQSHGVALELHIAGGGPRRAALERLATHLRLDARFHGHVADRQRLLAVLDGCDLFVSPSASEGLPRSMIEAMARGLPAAGADAVGVRELVRPQELLPVGNVRALAALLEQLAADPARLAAMSRHGVETAARYSTAVLSPKRARLYRTLLEASGNSVSIPSNARPRAA